MPRVKPVYNGFEQGPIRPPSEAASLLLRVTRNCPWNRCSFCPVYKGANFSLRPVQHVLQDIDMLSKQVALLRKHLDVYGQLNHRDLSQFSEGCDDNEQVALYAAYSWLDEGVQSIFLQDADSLVIKSGDLICILDHIRKSFPQVKRITSYARSQTIDRISEVDLDRIAAAGLNRIHIGLESGSDAVLKLVQKGADQSMHIRAGQKVKKAGMELSEYVMPGLGGRSLSQTHAVETAEALNQINPDFIRLRTLAIPHRTELYNDWQNGDFVKMTDCEVAEEILLLLENLEGISSTLQSDHILNLFQEVEGKVPQDNQAMMAVIQKFLELPAEEQMLYQVGRRLGIFVRLADLEQVANRQRVISACHNYKITPGNVDDKIDELMNRFI
ncbi:MAG: radical SAM protein [Desulfuromusa sp.]|nr:radical SAM protein [Desulfuromusa sp.]